MINTKIVATLGPATNSLAVIKKMIQAGVSVVRLNFSHGNYADHRLLIKNVRRASRELGRPVAILQDLQGPRIRVGNLPDAGVELVRGQKLVLSFGRTRRLGADCIPVDLTTAPRLRAGNKILIHDGLVELKVISQKGNEVNCQVIRGGSIFSHKGVNIPNVKIAAPVITTKDRRDLRFGLAQGVDWVALSFVNSARDVTNLRRLVVKQQVKIMAKIERPQAVRNIKSIIAASDGIMVARGDLGVEISPQRVPIVQKEIISRCLLAAKPVLVATQMLDSMIRNPLPTRAEVSDVANAVIDHTDAVMLSGETAFGKYPVPAVELMSKIVAETEKSPYDDVVNTRLFTKNNNRYQAIAQSVFNLVASTKAQAIVVLSRSGFSAQLIARHRPETPIIALVASDKILRQLNLVWGVRAYKIGVKKSLDTLIRQAIALVKKLKLVRPGSNVVIVTGQPIGRAEHANLVEVYKV